MKINIENHLEFFPNARIHYENGEINGWWREGNSYATKHQYYGEYPPSYLRRIHSLLPHFLCYPTLHLFSGVVSSAQNEVTFDINESLNPDACGNANNLSEYFESKQFSLILADPPYSKKDAEEYGYKMPNIPRVFREMRKIIKDNGLVVWMCTRKPIYRSRPPNPDWIYRGQIGYDLGTNRLFRTVLFFEPNVESA